MSKTDAVEEFSVGTKVVYPSHGVGEITSIVEKTLGGMKQEFIKISFEDGKGTTVMVPKSQCQKVGLRRVLDQGKVEEVYEILRQKVRKTRLETWNRRFRDYSFKLNSGSLFEIAEVLRDLNQISEFKELSFGEKQLLENARSLLANEIAIVKSRSKERILKELESVISNKDEVSSVAVAGTDSQSAA